MTTASGHNLVYNLVLFTCILFVSLFYGYIKCHMTNHPHRDRSPSTLNHTQILSKISYFIVAISICFYLDIAFYLVHNLTHMITASTCRIGMICGVIVLTLHKAAMYLLVAIRAQILQSLQYNSGGHSFKISIALILIYVVIIVYNITQIAFNPHDITLAHGLCTSTATLRLLISQFAADIIIGVYCMAVFVLRLRWLLDSERKNIDERLGVSIKKLLIYSSVPLLASVLVYPSGIAFQIMYPHSQGIWAFKLDIFVDVCCIVMQVRSYGKRAMVGDVDNRSHPDVRGLEITSTSTTSDEHSRDVSDSSSATATTANGDHTSPKLLRDVSERSIHDKPEWD